MLTSIRGAHSRNGSLTEPCPQPPTPLCYQLLKLRLLTNLQTIGNVASTFIVEDSRAKTLSKRQRKFCGNFCWFTI